MAMLHIIDKVHGDKRIQWEPENKKDLKKVEKILKEKLKDGWLAYGYKVGKKIAEQIRKFDPSFDRIVVTPPFAGG